MVMDAVIARIIEIEKQSAINIERAEAAYHKNIEAHRNALGQKKEKAHAEIISAENTRCTEALEELKKQLKKASLTSEKDFESRFNDLALVDAIKKRIVAILLME